MDESVPVAEEKTNPRKTPWLRITTMVVFGLLYAYDLFEAISNTFWVSTLVTKSNQDLKLDEANMFTIPWGILIANMLLPVVVFGVCLLLSRKRNVGTLAFVLLTGLGVVGALTLSLSALAGAVN